MKSLCYEGVVRLFVLASILFAGCELGEQPQHLSESDLCGNGTVDEGEMCDTTVDCKELDILYASKIIDCSRCSVYAKSQCEVQCKDGDNDGYGEGCEAGPDCDDHDNRYSNNCEFNPYVRSAEYVGATAKFEVGCSEDDCSLSCQLDDEEPFVCDDDEVFFGRIARGPHSFSALVTEEREGYTPNESKTIDWVTTYLEGTWQTMAADYSAFCAISGAGELYCFTNIVDTLNLSPNIFSTNTDLRDSIFATLPELATNKVGWTVIETETGSFCAISPDSNLYCWSKSADFGGDSIPRSVKHETYPQLATTQNGWTDISLAYKHGCGISHGSLYCWGLYKTFQSYDYATTEPEKAATASNWVTVETEQFHKCGIQDNGKLFCWGSHLYGRVGNGIDSYTYSAAPVEISPGTTWANLSAGTDSTCAITTDSRLFCWGKNENGVIGDGTIDARSGPTPILPTVNFRAVSVNSTHTCAISTAGEMYCWGDNRDGQLGNGTTTSTLLPSKVASSADWAQVAVSFRRTCGITVDGRLDCWGTSDLGDGSLESKLTPDLD